MPPRRSRVASRRAPCRRAPTTITRPPVRARYARPMRRTPARSPCSRASSARIESRARRARPSRHPPALLGGVQDAERDLEQQQDDERQRDVAEEQPSPHGRRLRPPGPRAGTRRRAPSRSSVDRRASCAPTPRGRRASWSARTSAGPRPARGSSCGEDHARLLGEQREQVELLGREVELRAREGDAVGPDVDDERRRARVARCRRPGGDAARRVTARIRATSSRKPNGFTR